MITDKHRLQIPDVLLDAYNGTVVEVPKGETIVLQGEPSSVFFVVKHGRVKMATMNEQGKEFVQGYFEEGESFGEPPFFTRSSYPASAVAITDCEIWKIRRPDFLRLLKEHSEVHLAITESLSERLEYKSMMLSELAVEEAEHRIATLLSYFRDREESAGRSFLVPFSRQQIADMTGLRVETVIRTVKAMEQKNVLLIDEDGRIVLKW